MIERDFFDVRSEQVSHANMIVMNPPFSSADKHILHTWKIAPEGCELIALCNWETVRNGYSYGRSELKAMIDNYGESQNLGNCFSTAERKTDVEIGLIRLFKPVLSSDFDWDGFYYDTETVGQNEALMTYNEVRAMVNTYVAVVKMFR